MILRPEARGGRREARQGGGGRGMLAVVERTGGGRGWGSGGRAGGCGRTGGSPPLIPSRGQEEG